MKKNPLLPLLIVIALTFAAIAIFIFRKDLFFSEIVEENEYKYKIVLANGEWEPYFSETLENNGFVSHIVTQAFALESVEVEYVFLPWGRGLEEAGLGKWSGTMGWAKTPEREELFYFSEKSITDDNHVFFHLKSNDFDWNTVEDLKDVKIAAIDGFFYGNDLEKAEKDKLIYIDRGIEDQIILKKLLAGKVDVAILDKSVGYKLINTLFTSEEAQSITHHPLSVVKSQNHLLLNKIDPQNEMLIGLFNKGYQKMIDSGKVDDYWQDFEAGKY